MAPLLVFSGCTTTAADASLTEGLRRLLGISSQRALARLVTANGYLNDPDIRIALPTGRDDRSAAVLGALLRSAPVQRQLMLVVNRTAGEAADRAAPVVYDAIRSLTFSDALGIARGGPTAATSYLEQSIGDRIIDAMFPEVGDALHQIGGGSILGPVLGAATGIDIPAMQWAVTHQASQGLWRAIGQEEAAIRAVPARAGDPLVQAILSGQMLRWDELELADKADILDSCRICPVCAQGMITDAEMYRQHAQKHRDEAESTALPNVRARALHAAERWTQMADQAERSSTAAIKRDVAKAERNTKMDVSD